MKQRPYKQVDVFTAVPYLGNPLAVVMDGSDLSDAEMQHFAHWTNLSETTFLRPPSPHAAAQGADYSVRIFTPHIELPFAGHPTLGSCHAWLQAGGTPQHPDTIVQECQVGLVTIRRDGTRLAFAAPPLKRSQPVPALLARVITALGLKPQQVLSAQLLDNGPVFLGLLLDSPQTVLELTPNHLSLKNLGQKVGVAGMEIAQGTPNLIARSNREARAFGERSNALDPMIEVRVFSAAMGANEDPVTGSLNAALAQWLIAEGHAPSAYVASQGCCLGRDGQVHIEQDDNGQVWVGGNSVTCVEGQVHL